MKLLRLTFGKSRTEIRWTDRRAMTFDQLADLLAECPVGSKDGPCYTPAIFAGVARRMDQAVQIDIAVLDSDCGHSLDEIEQAVQTRGWRAIIHSTYSHLSEHTQINAKHYDKWRSNEESAGGRATPGNYLLSKKGYLPSVVDGASIIDEIDVSGTRFYSIKHNPCPKFRIVIPLASPWIATDYTNQTVANQYWANRIAALANSLELSHDQSCTDSSRLFYLPRRKEGQEFLFRVLDGMECSFWDLPDAPAPMHLEPEPLNYSNSTPYPAAPVQTIIANNIIRGDDCKIDLVTWAAEYARRFEIVEALRFRAPHVFSHRVVKVKKHIKCPNGEHHISSGPDDGTGCFVVNASGMAYAELPEVKSGFYIKCMHNGCAEFDRLDHLRALIEKGFLCIEDLTDERFLMPAPPEIDFSEILNQGRPPVAVPSEEDTPPHTCSVPSDCPAPTGPRDGTTVRQNAVISCTDAITSLVNANALDVDEPENELGDITTIESFPDPICPADGYGLPLIQLRAGELHLAATAGEEALLAAGLPIYQRGQILVQPVTTEVPASRGRMTQMAGLAKLNVHNIVDKLCQTAKWERFDARAGRWVRANPSPQVANIILSRHGQWLVPTVAGVITTPTLRNDGTILSDPGYDAKTRLYHVADSNLILSSDVHEPSRAAAEKSLALLSELLSEFPFVNFKENGKPDREVAKAVALSALITPVVRGALSVVPAHAFRANTAGSGKSYLADVASAISSGRPCPVISAGPDEAETEKRIAGLLLAGYPLISIDNVNGELGGDLLCQAIERPLIRIRPLGKSDINEIESASTIFCTGNQLRVRGDMVRRTLVCDLDAGVERPELRTFRSDPVAKVLADRSTYVSACLTIVRAYLAAPDHIRLPPLASFGDWSDLVRSALVWLGCADPVESMEAAREDDPELGELREVIGLWETAAALGEGVTAKALAKKAEQQHPSKCGEPMDFACPELRDVLLRVAGERGAISTRRLGQWLQKREGRIVGGRRIKRQRNAGGGLTRWALEIA